MEDREQLMELMRLSPPAPSSQQSSSSSSSPPLQEEEEVEQALMSPPLPTQLPPSSTTARSIRCKESQTRDATLKRKRGVVVGAKAAMIHQTTGEKIKVEYDEFHKGPANPKIRGMISRDIGSCVKASVPMEAPSYKKLEKKHRKIVEKHLLVHYHIPVDHHGLWNYVQTTAANRYKDWKSDCRQHWLQWKEEVPLEFINRPAQWEWLCTHFNDPNNVALCAEMKEKRNAPSRMNHHSGTTAISYRVKKHENEGDPAPFVRAYEDVYAGDVLGGPRVEKMKAAVSKLREDRTAGQSDILPEPLPVETQVGIIDEVIGDKRGTVIRGVGRCMQPEPKKRRGARCSKEAMMGKRIRTLEDIVARFFAQQQSGTGSTLTSLDSNAAL